jgi:L-asparaginase
MTPADWVRLARLVLGAQEEQAVLLLHGTDTMAWTASALAFLLTLYGADGTPEARFGMPVVLTGSQRPLFEGDGLRPGTDALDNIRSSLAAFATGRREVMLSFGGVTFRGTRVMKLSTVDDRAFGYPNGGAPCPILPVADPAALIAQLEGMAPHLGARAVLTLTPNPGDHDLFGKWVRATIKEMGEKLGAIFLNGYGIGNFPARRILAPVLRAAHDAGVLIAAGTQVPHGPVDPSTYGAGHWLAGCGAMAIADMTPAAAHAKLHVALALGAARGWDRAAMERFFRSPVAGETKA